MDERNWVNRCYTGALVLFSLAGAGVIWSHFYQSRAEEVCFKLEIKKTNSLKDIIMQLIHDEPVNWRLFQNNNYRTFNGTYCNGMHLE